MANQTEVTTTQQNDLVESVLRRINQFKESGGLRLHLDYSPENALKSAWLILQDTKDRNDKPALEVTSKVSQANALLNMVLQGLNPAKSQCYFIVYGNKLTMQRSYFGIIAVANRDGGVVGTPIAREIYEDDEFDYEIDNNTGYIRILVHKQSLKSLGAGEKIIGAYAILELKNGDKYIEVMSIHQIKQSWKQGATKGTSPAHVNFTAEMCKRTVIAKACKIFINSSSDAALFDDDDDYISATQPIMSEANKGAEIGFIDVIENEPQIAEPTEEPIAEEPKLKREYHKKAESSLVRETAPEQNIQQQEIAEAGF